MAPREPQRTFLRRDMFGVGEHIPKIREIDVVKVAPNPRQPRKFFDAAALAELAASIAAKGLLQPILVRPIGDGDSFEIVAGERRWRAIQQISWTTLPAIVTHGDADEIALIENMQREGLQPLEEAEAVERLMRLHNYTLEEAGRTLGKSKSSMSELLSMLKLPEAIRAAVRTSERQVSKSALIELAKMPEDLQAVAWDAVRTGGAPLSVRSTRAARQNNGAREANGAGEPQAPVAIAIKGAVKGLYSFARRASAHQGDLSQEDLKALREAKRRADEAYKALTMRANQAE